jgi:sugar lactone lactonase YvrE
VSRRSTRRTLALRALLLAFLLALGLLLVRLDRINEGFSEIAVDPSDGTLWVVVEAGASVGRVGHLSTSGRVLRRIEADRFGAHTPEGVAVDPTDDTLWVVDDGGDETTGVYHITKAGRLISSFPTSLYDGDASSPQGIAVDPVDGSLWIADNKTDRIYNVRRDGALVHSFPTRPAPLHTRNPQGVSVDGENGSLWISARDTQRIYNVSQSGDHVLSSFVASAFDPSAENPTGVAFARAAQPGSASVLWITDDVRRRVYAVDPSGRLIEFFAQSLYLWPRQD